MTMQILLIITILATIACSLAALFAWQVCRNIQKESQRFFSSTEYCIEIPPILRTSPKRPAVPLEA